MATIFIEKKTTYATNIRFLQNMFSLISDSERHGIPLSPPVWVKFSAYVENFFFALTYEASKVIKSRK